MPIALFWPVCAPDELFPLLLLPLPVAAAPLSVPVGLAEPVVMGGV